MGAVGFAHGPSAARSYARFRIRRTPGCEETEHRPPLAGERDCFHHNLRHLLFHSSQTSSSLLIVVVAARRSIASSLPLVLCLRYVPFDCSFTASPAAVTLSGAESFIGHTVRFLYSRCSFHDKEQLAFWLLDYPTSIANTLGGNIRSEPAWSLETVTTTVFIPFQQGLTEVQLRVISFRAKATTPTTVSRFVQSQRRNEQTTFVIV